MRNLNGNWRKITLWHRIYFLRNNRRVNLLVVYCFCVHHLCPIFSDICRLSSTPTASPPHHTLKMQNLDNRLASFNPITKPKSKAKPQFPLEASTHPHLTPRALAEAGFYHTPGSSSPSFDNCTCFLCNLELGGWDEDDDPFEEHAKRAGCAWAEMFCAVKIEKRKRDRSNGQYT